MTQPAGLDFSSLDVGGSQSDLLQSLARFLEEVAEYHGSDSEEGSGGKGGGGGQRHQCGCGGNGPGGNDEVSLDGEFSIVGDPHISGAVKVDGKEVKFNFTTEGGSGKVINLLDTDTPDIRGKFDKLTRADGNTYVTEETITFGDKDDSVSIDADDDKVKLNGKEIEDGVHHVNGNTITKAGDKVTILTADGQKIVIDDKGDYLDTKVTLDDFESKQIGGMVGDAVKGKTNDEAKDYEFSPVPPVGGGGEKDSKWAVQLLRSLAGMLLKSDPDLSQFLTALANFIEQSQGGKEVGAAA
jgi:hypothetical protein